MSSMAAKIETLIGIILLLLALLGFIFLIVLNLPREDEVNRQAQPLPEIPRTFFSSDNEVTKKIRELNVPAGVPVTVDQGSLGRSSVFDNF